MLGKIWGEKPHERNESNKMEKPGTGLRRRVHVPLQIVGSSSSSSAPPSVVRRLMPKAEVEAKYAEKMEEILQNTFGHPQFRPSQREVMVSILSGTSCNLNLTGIA